MRPPFARRRPLMLGALLAVLTIGLACNEDEIEPEPEVATLRIIVGTQTVDVDIETNVVTGGPIVMAASTDFTAQFLKADGAPEALVTDAEFRLDVTPVNTGVVTFARSGPFAGTLTKVAAGSTTIEFALFHLEEMHHEWENRSVPITVN